MRVISTAILAMLLAAPAGSAADTAAGDTGHVPYVPSQEIQDAQREFEDARFGIFLHWGLYSLFGQGEWFINNANLDCNEYAKAARAFYPADFDAARWVSAIKDSGAKYICFTTRHHEGFSMWDTAQSDYNIVKATPYGHDVLRDLADECHKQDMRLHLYYSHADWTRSDYPPGRSGGAGRDSTKIDWPAYRQFMDNQLTELLTQYGPVGAIWFDGWWDHDSDSVPFDWELREQYDLIHRLQPGCLVANNHHQVPFEGEDIQIFERDLPGQNTAGLSGQAISRLPLETCNTMNGMWGYKIVDQDYKSSETLIRYLLNAAGMGANLLLNIGPQPNGELPAAALDRLTEIGRWMRRYGDTVYGTRAGDVAPQEWGVTTRKGDTLYVHIFDPELTEVSLPLTCRVTSASDLVDEANEPAVTATDNGYLIRFRKGGDEPVPHIIKLTTR